MPSFFSYIDIGDKMNQFITYYYQFSPSKIEKKKDYFLIQYLDTIYYLYEVSDLNMVDWQYSVTKSIPFYCDFIFNRFQSIFSDLENHSFVLLKRSIFSFSIYEYFLSFYYYDCHFKLFWYQAWIKRSDFLENYFFQIKGTIPIVDDSFDYYLGLLEMAIYYIRDYSNYIGMGCIQQKKFSLSMMDNPLNTIIDVKERNFAEYLKYLFLSREYQSINLHELIQKNKGYYNFNIVIARVLYPNYYFDQLDEVICHGESSDTLIPFISRIIEFQKYIKLLIQEIQQFVYIKKVSF